MLQVSKLDSILDTEQAWQDFYSDVVGERWSTEDSARYIRLNPDLGFQPPDLDDKHSLHRIQRKVRELIKTDQELMSTVEDVANRLIASSFYFKNLKIQNDNDVFVCSGK